MCDILFWIIIFGCSFVDIQVSLSNSEQGYKCSVAIQFRAVRAKMGQLPVMAAASCYSPLDLVTSSSSTDTVDQVTARHAGRDNNNNKPISRLHQFAFNTHLDVTRQNRLQEPSPTWWRMFLFVQHDGELERNLTFPHVLIQSVIISARAVVHCGITRRQTLQGGGIFQPGRWRCCWLLEFPPITSRPWKRGNFF